MMPTYDVFVVLEGWAKVRVDAESKEAARRKVTSSTAAIRLLNSRHEDIGQIVEPRPELAVSETEVEVFRPDNDVAYHAPAGSARRTPRTR